MPRRRRIADPVPERYYRNGDLALGTYLLALLHGLLDRPHGKAIGARDLMRAAFPYAPGSSNPGPTKGTYTALRDQIRRLPTSWVARSKVGRLTCYRLLPRGRAVLEGRIPARLGGGGKYVPGLQWRAD